MSKIIALAYLLVPNHFFTGMAPDYKNLVRVGKYGILVHHNGTVYGFYFRKIQF